MRFLVDMPLSPALARWLAEKGHDSVHASEIGLSSATDTQVIKRAKNEGRTIVTAHLDYPHLLALAGATEPSVILFRDGDWSEADAIVRVGDVLEALTPKEIGQSIVVIERYRIRRRRLPLTPSAS